MNTIQFLPPKLLDFKFKLPTTLELVSDLSDPRIRYLCDLQIDFKTPNLYTEDKDELKTWAVLNWFRDSHEELCRGVDSRGRIFNGDFELPLGDYLIKITQARSIEVGGNPRPTFERGLHKSGFHDLTYIRFKEATIRLTKDGKPCDLKTMTEVFRSNYCYLRHYFSV